MAGLVNENFDVSLERGFEIMAEIVSKIAFTAFTKKEDGIGDEDIIEFIYMMFNGKERDFAFLSFGRITEQHSSRPKNGGSGAIQIAFNIQDDYEFKTREELAEKLQRRFQKAYDKIMGDARH